MQLRLLKQGIYIHCTNNKCKEVFSDGDLYLKHVAIQCNQMILSATCNKEFQTIHMASSHICNVSVNDFSDKNAFHFELLLCVNIFLPKIYRIKYTFIKKFLV